MGPLARGREVLEVLLLRASVVEDENLLRRDVAQMDGAVAVDDIFCEEAKLVSQ